jgi:dGTPase
MMDWNHILSTRRLGQENYTFNPEAARSDFQRDFDRIIFSSPFRRLQNKTQVFPLPGGIFVHNRLTHSLEVASVGRSLGTNVSNYLLKEEHYKSNPLIYELGSAVAAACLAHDLGNPPFGHSGEDAISFYFSEGAGKQYQERFSDEQWLDLTHYEGNANAFRLLTQKLQGRREGGYSLTYTTLAAIMKYPYPSVAGLKKTAKHRKKYGFFSAGEETYRKIAEELKINIVQENPLICVRHPLVYLVEAADDICYNIIDLEDAHRLGIIGQEETMNFLRGFYANDETETRRIEKTLSKVTDPNEQISYLRSKVIGSLIQACSDIFILNMENILRGEYHKSLVDELEGDFASALQKIKDYSVENIYNHKSVVKIEVAGFKVLGGLVEEFIPAILNKSNPYTAKLLRIVPKQFMPDENTSDYEKILLMLDYISGMTDIFAVDTFRQIKGIDISYA